MFQDYRDEVFDIATFDEIIIHLTCKKVVDVIFAAISRKSDDGDLIWDLRDVG